MQERDIYQTILDVQQRGQPVALATVIRTHGSIPRHVGSKMLVRPDGSIIGTVGGGAMEARVIQDAIRAIASGEAAISTYTLNDLGAGDPGICGGSVEIFIEPLTNLPTLVVIGCGHVGKALAELALWMEYRVIVSDDRAELCNAEVLPGMHGYVVAPPAQLAQHIVLTPTTYIAAVTRGLPVDVELFPPLLQANVAYIGLIGSRRRWALTVKALEERGLSRQLIERIRAPIGLELQAETPKEIALSIMAEITMLRRGGDGQPMGVNANQSEAHLTKPS